MKLVFILLVCLAFQLNKSQPAPPTTEPQPTPSSEPIPSHQPTPVPESSSEPIPSHQPTSEPAPLHQPIPSHEPTSEPAPLHQPTSEPAPLHQPIPSHEPTSSPESSSPQPIPSHEPTSVPESFSPQPIPSHEPTSAPESFSPQPIPSHPPTKVPQPTPSEPIPSHQPTIVPQPTSPEPYLPFPTPEPYLPSPDSDVWHWVDLGLHIALIVVGLCWLIIGYRIISIILFVAGFIVFSFVSLELLTTLVVDKGNLAKWIAYAIAGGLGLIGGCVFVVLKKVGVFLYGALFGILFSSLVLSRTPLATLSISPMIQLIVLLCTGVLFGIVAVIFERVIFIIGTSFNGSYLIFNSIDSEWIQSGASDMLIHIFSDFNTPIYFDVGNWKAYLILAAMIILAVVGIVIQFRWTAGEQKSKTNEDVPLLTTINV